MNGFEPLHGHGQPADHGLAGNIKIMPGPPDLLLTVMRQVIAIFSDDDGRQQTGRGRERSCKRWSGAMTGAWNG